MTIGPGRPSNADNVAKVLDRVLDKGVVIDAWLRLSVVGIDLLTVEARIVVASIATYLKHSDALSVVSPTSRPAGDATGQSVALFSQRTAPVLMSTTSKRSGLASRLGTFASVDHRR